MSTEEQDLLGGSVKASWRRFLTPRHVTVTALALFFDSLLTLLEGWALRRGRWWGRWLVVVAPTCQGRMRLLAMVTDSKSIRRYLAKVGEPTEPPARSPSRGPPFWKSVVLRQKMLDGANLGA